MYIYKERYTHPYTGSKVRERWRKGRSRLNVNAWHTVCVFGNQQVGVEENLTVAPLLKVLIPTIYWGS
jgi:hypothetical protein